MPRIGLHASHEQIPWFQSARSSPDTPYRDFYVWVDEKPPEKPAMANPEVRDEIAQVVGYRLRRPGQRIAP